MASDKEVNHAVQFEFLVYIYLETFYEDDMSPFLLRLSYFSLASFKNMLRGSGIVLCPSKYKTIN
jgi:hypothetical protein